VARPDAKKTMSTDPISAYATQFGTKQAAICDFLRKVIEGALPRATGMISHRRPVWFIGENPVVGYSAKRASVTLLFWNGRNFGDPMLTGVGTFHAAQITYQDVADIDTKALCRWLERAGTDIWDLVGTRNRMLAPRRSS
jgi:hypothetical protein